VKFCPHCSNFQSDAATYCPDDGTELRRIHDPYLGRTIAGRYKLVRRLGAGGMSSVYLAHHVMIERLSALKILRSDLSRHPTHRERFLREARAVNRINHPNIVEISDLGEADGVVYLVMEYVDGPSLHQEIGAGPFPWERAVRIGLQVAAALARAHQMDIVHRDLKPENILLAPQRRDPASLAPYPPVAHAENELVKLTDFGIAKLLDEPAITVGEQLFGTPGYIAPEYLQGSTADPRSDLYSLGVILYEMTTGVLPYDLRGAALLAAPLREDPIPPSDRVRGYSPALETLILHLLARDPDRRPPDAFAVYDALVYLLRGVHLESPDGAPVLSSTPAATRISYNSQRGVREDAKTMDVTPTPSELVPVSVEVVGLPVPSSVGLAPWRTALAEIESLLASPDAPVAALGDEAREQTLELLMLARTKVASLERAARAAKAQQAEVDALEADGREFRADIGRALDELVLDRSRERAHVEAASRRLAAMEEDPTADRTSDAAVWESAALSEESGESRVAEEDLTFQIDALQRRLAEKNASVEQALALASGALEGSLVAVRHLTYELERLVADARCLASGDEGLPLTHRPAC
jgi:serine/threonine-protein kinase